MNKKSRDNSFQPSFAVTLGLIVLVGLLIFLFLPSSIRQGTADGITGFFTNLFTVWIPGFFVVVIPWIFFQIMVIIGLIIYYLAPMIIAMILKSEVYKFGYSEGQNATIWIISSIVLGMAWLIAPTFLIAGWFEDFLRITVRYSFENVHWASGIGAFLSSGFWFATSQDDGSPADD